MLSVWFLLIFFIILFTIIIYKIRVDPFTIGIYIYNVICNISHFLKLSQGHHQLCLPIAVVLVIFYHWLERNQTVLTTHVQHVVYPPVYLSDPSSRVPQTLHNVHQNYPRTHRYPQCLNRLQHCVYHVWTRLENVRPNIIQQVDKSIFVSETLNP